MLEISNICAGYGRTEVLHSLSISTGNSGILSILGHNGAGKSTLLRAAVGLIKPTSGSVKLFGQDVTSTSTHERVKLGMAYVPQGQQSFTQLSCMENLQVVADLQGRAGRERIAEALDRFPALTQVLDRQAGLLSGGQRQQLAIARALITAPKILLLDEPTEGIQPSVVAEIQRTIIDLANDGMSIVLVEQNIGFALEAASNYAIVARGQVVATGQGGETTVEKQEKVRESLAI
ncbi:ABC transporter ATP-binding protein [Corynebacterium suranareeae]|uniref:ABC transporter ATP-binding protein n=1 Tax=Corynebacterium suranareeae TaxID=2506452 RepID=A0A160PPC3_9CORY|nr:urea ABC transporter ATP-binding subunit UrtE [Corynebacterium suranareeae]BAU95316.1 ABC transporter ATP-binding protein [Corynebacterium suranareeae]